ASHLRAIAVKYSIQRLMPSCRQFLISFPDDLRCNTYRNFRRSFTKNIYADGSKHVLHFFRVNSFLVQFFKKCFDLFIATDEPDVCKGFAKQLLQCCLVCTVTKCYNNNMILL